jgi:hypothetical protein
LAVSFSGAPLYPVQPAVQQRAQAHKNKAPNAATKEGGA